MQKKATLFVRTCVVSGAMFFCGPVLADGLNVDQNRELANYVIQLKKDPKGPFEAIRWFCPDGTVIPAQSRCKDPGGIQRAVHKKRIQDIGAKYGIYLGQILAGSDKEAFLDRQNNYSRLRQYGIEKYLRSVDDGWILRRGRFYRGAYQSEDEEAWGKTFLSWMLSDSSLIRTNFFLCREAVRGIPHRDEDVSLERIRVLSKTIADSVPSFMDIRIKIHGQPDSTDRQRVVKFRESKQGTLSTGIVTMLDELQAEIGHAFAGSSVRKLEQYVRSSVLPHAISARLAPLTAIETPPAPRLCASLAELLFEVRMAIGAASAPALRLTLMDLSLDLEDVLFSSAGAWQPHTVGELLKRCRSFAKAAAGCGYMETNEWEQISATLGTESKEGRLRFESFAALFETARRSLEWGSAMVRAHYGAEASRFSSFEPLANGFIDDRLHSSVLLRLGDAVGDLADYYFAKANIRNDILGVPSQNQARGLNAGYARGELVVVAGEPEGIEFKADKIYLMLRPPSSLKPVAGIGTATEGNAVSHVQLLARNLGIPNMVLSSRLLKDLEPSAGQSVFYAVSRKGRVVMKHVTHMDERERALFAKRGEPSTRVSIPTDRLDRSNTQLVEVHALRASHSGKICGPKAANLGQLGAMYPDKVAPGFVIPFGVFYQHMQQRMPGTDSTYWHYLSQTFPAGNDEEAWDEFSEAQIVQKLGKLRDAIGRMKLLPEFEQSFRRRFREVFGSAVGTTGVFIRSDTNVEDRKEFTGAGLNLTVPNVVAESDILQAIRDVWASPYSERSCRWRQRYLRNPRHVYPSILVLRSVNCDKSGVMITTGLFSGSSENATVSFNRGVGGAVDGQAAEVYELCKDGTHVLYGAAREPLSVSLPKSGGITKTPVTFDSRILGDSELSALQRMALDLRKRLPSTPGIESEGPFDVELGFERDNLWLFQVRPFVENKNAKSSNYLRSLDPGQPKNAWIRLDEKLAGD